MATDARVRILGQDATKAAFASVQGQLAKTEGIVKKFGGVLAGVFATRQITGQINRVVRLGESVTDLGTKLGVSAASLTEWKFIVERTGASFGTFTTALQRQTRRLQEAAEGSGAAGDALQRLGLSVDELLKLPADQTFERIANRLRDIESPAEQVRLAFQLWDSEGVSLLQTVNGVTGGFGALRAEAIATGNALNNEQIASLKRAQEAWDQLGESVTGFINKIVVDLAPSITAGVGVVQAVFTRLLDVVREFAGVGAVVAQAVQGNFTEAGRIIEQVNRDSAASIQRFDRAIESAWSNLINGQNQVRAAVQQTTGAIANQGSDLLRSQDQVASAVDRSTRAIGEQGDELGRTGRLTELWAGQVDFIRRKHREWFDSTRQNTVALTELGNVALPRVGNQVTNLGRAYDSLNRSARQTAQVIAETNRFATESQQQQTLRLRAPGNGFWVYGIGSNRVLMRGMQAIRKLAPGEGIPASGQFATGTSLVPRDMTAKLEAGERVISNNTTVNIDITGAPTDTFGSRDWVRAVLVPEIQRATARTI